MADAERAAEAARHADCCAECRFFEPIAESGGHGQCHRHAPVAGNDWSWPYLRATDWCGEFEVTVRAEAADAQRDALVAALRASDEANDFAYGALRDAVVDALDKPAGYAVIRMIQAAREQARAALARVESKRKETP